MNYIWGLWAPLSFVTSIASIQWEFTFGVVINLFWSIYGVEYLFANISEK